jgi:hypothetical protein
MSRFVGSSLLALVSIAGPSLATPNRTECVANRDKLLGALDRHCAAVGEPDLRRACGLMRARLVDCREPGEVRPNGEYNGIVYELFDPQDPGALFRLEVGVDQGAWRVDRLSRVLDKSSEAIGECHGALRGSLRRALAAHCRDAVCHALDAELKRCGRWLPASRGVDGAVHVTTHDPTSNDKPGHNRQCQATFKAATDGWQVVDIKCCADCL